MESPSYAILVVDDNEMNRDMLSRRLLRRGLEVDLAEDGHQALARLEERNYGLVLLDIMMPGIDGIEVLKRIRQTKGPGDLPVIMVTAKDASEDVVEALKLGANDYVTKPLDFPVVLARVQTQLQLKRAHDALEEKNAFIKKIFGRYVTDDVVRSLLETPEGLRLGGERREVTVMMSDLRGFSSICERLSPEEVVHLLNIYLGAMAEVIATERGTIDEFIGDAILAIFGAPFPLDDHRERALRCAIAMQLAMDGVNTLLAEKGLPALEMGIGVNTGEVVVGNIGSDVRAKYGVVGSHVNLTGRIESYTVGGQILASETTVIGLQDRLQIARSVEVEAKGIDLPITLHDVTGYRMGECLLELPREHDGERLLAPPLAVELSLLEGKHVVGVREIGALVSLSGRGARLRTDVELHPLGNLRLRLQHAPEAGELYAKVMEAPRDEPALLRFTSVPPDVMAHLGEASSA